MDHRDKMKISELVVRAFDGQITDQERRGLNEIINGSSDAMVWYLEFVDMLSCFTKYGTTDVAGFDFDAEEDIVENTSYLGKAIVAGSDVSHDNDFMETLQVLAECEDTAAGVTVEKPVEHDEADQPDERGSFLYDHFRRRPRAVRHWGRFTLKVALVAMVCMSLIWLDRWVLQERPSVPRPVVARLTDEIDAVWDTTMQIPYDTGEMLQDSYRLTEGFVSIRFDAGAKVTIEAPAEWALHTRDNMELIHGSVYAVVPEEAHGFSINAGNTKIVDRGTEFGIEVDKNNNTQLHVIKGKTLLFYGSKNGKKLEQEVNHGQARQVDSTGKIRDINLILKKFVRHIDSKIGAVWKGHKKLSLADIIGGGNGLGTGRLNVGIDPLTGKFKGSVKGYKREGNGRYIPVYNNSLIDGVFIPDENKNGFVVTSRGDRYTAFRDTNNKAWTEICNGFGSSPIDPELEKWFPKGVRLDGQVYGTYDKPALFLHGNSGITFDLDEIRKMIPRLEIDIFEASCAVPDSIDENKKANWAVFDVHVLLDGQQCFYRESLNANTKKISISIPIQEDKRFLTLAITDGGNENWGDYAVFTEPQLFLRAK